MCRIRPKNQFLDFLGVFDQFLIPQGLVQGRPTEVGLWAADQHFVKNLKKNVQNTDF
jgi:hypothetical protein